MTSYGRIAALERKGAPAVLCTVVAAHGSTPRKAGSKMVVFADGGFEGTIGGGEMESRVIEVALDTLKTGRPQLLHYDFTDPKRGDPGVCGGQMEVYVEPIVPPEKVIVYGAGHVGRAVAELADWLGLDVALCDDRPEMVKETAGLPITCQVVAPDALADQVTIHKRTAVIFTTRGVDVDQLALPGVLASPAAYVGVIGSRRRWQTALDALQADGIDTAALSRVVSPIGLEIEAETPKEIAVSVLAEVMMVLRGGDGARMGAADGLHSAGQAVESD